MHLFDPLRGGKWRAALTTVSTIFGALVAEHVITGSWTGTVMSILAAVVAGVQGTTHLTDVGNVPTPVPAAVPASPAPTPAPVPVDPLAPDAPPDPPDEPTDGTSGEVEPA